MQLHFQKKGQGAPLVLLHGWGCDGSIFKALTQQLSQAFTVFVVDLPGFGKSQEPTQTWGIYEYANAVETFLTQHHIANPTIVGHSFGGKIAIILASRIPVAKLVLTGCAGIKPSRNALYYAKVYAYKTAKKLLSLPIVRDYKAELLANYIKSHGSSDYKAASPRMKKVLSTIVNQHVSAEMQRITAPTLLIWGQNDTATPAQHGKKMQQYIKGATLSIFENSGHYAFFDEPERFSRVLNNFLAP